eukprot:jgi/Tetstr1/423637/TSEL_014273.t1
MRIALSFTSPLSTIFVTQTRRLRLTSKMTLTPRSLTHVPSRPAPCGERSTVPPTRLLSASASHGVCLRFIDFSLDPSGGGRMLTYTRQDNTNAARAHFILVAMEQLSGLTVVDPGTQKGKTSCPPTNPGRTPSPDDYPSGRGGRGQGRGPCGGQGRGSGRNRSLGYGPRPQAEAEATESSAQYNPLSTAEPAADSSTRISNQSEHQVIATEKNAAGGATPIRDRNPTPREKRNCA